MPYSILTYPGDGVTTTWPINFTLGFISRSDVKCRVGNEVDGLNQPVYRTLTWISDGLVQVQGTPAAIGQNVEFTRTVSKTSLTHDYQDGAAITEQNLDESNLQLIMLLHEILDDRLRVIPAYNWDMNAKRIVNLGAGVDPTDAVTVQQAAQAIALTPTAVQAAEDAAQAAVAATQAAVDAEAAASVALGVVSPEMRPVCSAATLSEGRAALDVYDKATVDLKAPLASPTFTGTVVVPTPARGDNSTKVASTEYVNSMTRPTTQKFTGGAGTYTTPANCKYLHVRICGGGGGGGGAGAGGAAGGTGGTTSFESWTAIGGAGGFSNTGGVAGGAGGSGGADGTGTLIKRVAGNAGGSCVVNATYTIPSMGGASALMAGAAPTLVQTSNGTSPAANTGAGASGATSSGVVLTGAGGGGAEYVEFIVHDPSASYSYSIGVGGGGGAGSYTGGVGGSGVVIVEEYYI